MLTNDASLHEENFFPTISQTAADGAIYLSAHNAAIVKVEGLEGIHRLPDSTIDVTSDQLASAREFFVQREQERQQREAAEKPHKLTVQIRATPPTVDGKLDEWSTADWATIDTRMTQVGDWGKRKVETRAAAAVSADRLYLAFETDDPKLLTNAGGPLPMLYKTGRALDLMLATDPSTDPKRRAPAAGDLRLLVTQVQGKTTAALYRPVALPGMKPDPVPFASPLRTIRFDRVDDVSSQVTLAASTARDEKAKKEVATYELSIPLATLGLKPTPGLTLSADIGLLRGNGFHTLQRAYWTNKATGIVSDEPSEAELIPQLWGKWEFIEEKR
jgi:hypothetical protein